ncbi:MAG: cupin domain-containing protein [Proteobacteria bacterium]|nr:cupin domain-containing protein [Pseudomonadota bacterium]
MRRNPAFDPKQFLQQQWQKTPLFLPGFLQDYLDPLSADELAGLACEESVESRLVRRHGVRDWSLEHGPFTEQLLQDLPAENWTLLVQAVDLWEDQVGILKELFNFLPSWRVDDVMVSFATPGGGVGPHFDYYDVFLVQGDGQRTWQVGACSASGLRVDETSGLALLDEFKAEAEYQLNPGDVLYLPPGFAHWGEAITPSFCYSVGFRAPSVGEMLAGFTDYLLPEANPAQRFTDTGREPAESCGEIKPENLENAYRSTLASLADEQRFRIWFGCHVTEPKYPELIEISAVPLTPKDLQLRLNKGDEVQRARTARFAYLKAPGSASVALFADGKDFSVSQANIQLINQLSETSHLKKRILRSKELDKEGLDLLLKLLNLLNQGSLTLVTNYPA